jgi:2-polyprenyl-6-methoxyphenol hydroxylase-like FAD-dependent oxidoreductase
MKVLIVGAGPAGRYSAYLLKPQDAAMPIRVVELNPAETERRPVVDKLQSAARSAQWSEDFAAHMRLEPLAMAWSYIQRSGRVVGDKPRLLSPRFVEGYEAWVSAQHLVLQPTLA